MTKQQASFIQTVLISVGVSAVTTVALALVAAWLYQTYGFRLPGVPVEQRPGEQVSEGLGRLNWQEAQAGRAPFVLTRAVRGGG